MEVLATGSVQTRPSINFVNFTDQPPAEHTFDNLRKCVGENASLGISGLRKFFKNLNS